MFINSKTELFDTRLSGTHDAGGGPSQGIIDFSEFETDFTSPFHRTNTHKNHWLLTTGVAGLVGACVVGGTLLGTFGLGTVHRPQVTAKVIETAEILQEPSPDIRRDRLLGVLGIARIVGRREFAEALVEDPDSRAAANGNADARIPQTGPTGSGGLIGSLVPEYNAGGSTRIGKSGGAARRQLARSAPSAKPWVLPARPSFEDDPLSVAALTPATIASRSTIPGAPARPVDEDIVIAQGQTLMGILTQRGANREEARRMIAALEPVYPTRLLRDGQKIRLSYLKGVDEFGLQIIRPTRLRFDSDAGRNVIVSLETNGDYVGVHAGSGNAVAALPGGGAAKQQRVNGTIRTSFYASATNQGIPRPIIARMMRIHSHDVDFQREVRDGDTFEVFYGEPLTGKGAGRKRNVVLYSALTLGGKTRGYYRFTTPDDGVTSYYDEKGRNAASFLIRTPVAGARISSRYGMRKHPILGYSRLHAGVDFAAPRGTPIKAAGNGVVERAGRNGAFGIYMRIRHANRYKTAYAHMHRLAKGMKPGKRVRQGQVIGYVGSTGRSTGPHLHYEVHRNGKRLNPMKIRVSKGRRLKGKLLARFKRQQRAIRAMMQGAPTSTRVASAAGAGQ